jgi:hypothetical protein
MTSGYYRKVTALQKKTTQMYSHMLHAWNIGQQLTPKSLAFCAANGYIDIYVYIYIHTYITLHYIPLYTSHHITSRHVASHRIASHHITYISIL